MAEYVDVAAVLPRISEIIDETLSLSGGKLDDSSEASLDRSVIEIMGAVPRADVAPVVHGEWAGTVCTACGTSWGDIDAVGDFFYCPICGAKMD